MKRIMIRIFSMMISLVVVVNVAMSSTYILASAENNVYSQLPCNYQEQMEIRGYSNPTSVIPLFDQNDNIVAYCFDFNNSYMIINLNGVVLEHSPEICSPYYGISGKAYYGGYLSYYYKSDNVFVNLYTLEKTNSITVSSVVNATSVDYTQAISYNNTSEVATPNIDTGYVTETIAGELKTLNYNNNNACGPLAVEIMLLYYDQYVNDSFVTSSMAQNTRDFFDYLIKAYFPTYLTTDSQLVSGLNKYLNDARLDYKANYLSFAFDMFVQSVMKNKRKPLILRLYKNPNSSSTWSIDHWVIISGLRYYYYQGKLASYEYRVNDGWGHNNVYIMYSTDYMEGVISIV